MSGVASVGSGILQWRRIRAQTYLTVLASAKISQHFNATRGRYAANGRQTRMNSRV
uniref:Secreted protein n=1 Tax=Mesocestoides corti TaxID=53468 RepID=A0A5K3EQK5_MESCO